MRRVAGTLGLLAAAAALGVAAGPARAEDDACAAVMAAVRSIGTAPQYRSVLVATTPTRRRPYETEQIVIGDLIYATSPGAGRWMKLPMTATDREALAAGLVRYPPHGCEAADPGGADAPTRMFSYKQDVSGPGSASNRLWVGRQDGRPRRQLTDEKISGAGGHAARGRTTRRIDMIKVKVNGEERSWDGDPSLPLLWYLRDELGLVGTKFGCGQALCGACTVHVEGSAARSCITAVSDVDGQNVVTIEGLHPHGDHPVQKAWRELNVPQCGFCQAGQIMQAAALLTENKNPSDDEIRGGMSGNICCCGCYQRIEAAVRVAATGT